MVSPDGKRTRRAIELVVLFGLVPALLAFADFSRKVLPTILVAAAVCVAWLRSDPGFARPRLWRLRGSGPHLRAEAPIALTVILIGSLAVWWLLPQHFLSFPRQRPFIWLLVMSLYPLLSAYPQEIIYRAFLHRRYAAVFESRHALVIASALAFGWAHVILRDPVPVILSTPIGYLIARRYERSRSLVVAAVLHGLYGGFAFTVGLGAYFYKGGR